MKKQIEQVAEFHQKFKVPILNKPSLIPEDRSNFRFKLMEEEVKEYAEAVKSGDLEAIAKELADILYSAFGTVLEHGLQNKIEDIFTVVHTSNLSKEYHQYKVKKGKDFKPADLKGILKAN